MFCFMFHVAVKADFIFTSLDESALRTPLRAWVEFVSCRTIDIYNSKPV